MKLYLWTTPNGYKPLILLEELGVKFELVKIALNGEQKKPSYLALNPNGRIPTLVDKDLVVFESGAILLYLAEKYDKFLPKTTKERYQVMQWLMFQMGGVGPMFGQLGHFLHLEQKIPYAIDRYQQEMHRLYQVLETRLQGKDYIAGDYSIADISLFPWVRKPSFYKTSFDNYPNVQNWVDKIASRKAVQKAMKVKFQ
jgi:GST-like protein